MLSFIPNPKYHTAFIVQWFIVWSLEEMGKKKNHDVNISYFMSFSQVECGVEYILPNE